jgi:hypothetical protein
VTFSGTAGQRVGLLTQPNNLCVNHTITAPDGTTQLYSNFNCSTDFSDVVVLPTTGTYTMFVNPNREQIGTTTFTLYPVPPDVTGTIAVNGTAASLTTTTPGQNGSLTFSGTAGQRVSLLTEYSSFCSGVKITEPDGTTQLYSNFNCGSAFSDVLILPTTGTYTIFANVNAEQVGNASFTLYNDPADASATITPGGGSVALTASVPGQNINLTFSGAAGDRVSLLMQLNSGLTPGCSPLVVLQPNGTTQVFSNTCANSSSFFTGVLTLPVTGTYSIQFNPLGTNTGTATFTLYSVPADASGSTTIGAAVSSYATTIPGQAIRVTFTGTASQSVHVNVAVVSATPANPCYRVTTLDPDGTTVLRGDQSCSSSYSSGSLTLPQNGTYTVVIAPNSVAIGTFSLGVITP